MKVLPYLVVLAVAACAGPQDVKSEPNPERRAKLALENADVALTAARDAYATQANAEVAQQLKELEAFVELARASLEETGKDPRRRPKAFKDGEIRTRSLLRRLDSLENAMDFDDRKLLEPAKAKLRDVHEAWLLGIITGKKKGED